MPANPPLTRPTEKGARDRGPTGGGSVRALLRGLEILRYINATGSARPGAIARALMIPRPTVYRLLHTLEEAGYVVFSASADQVRVTRLAAALGDSSSGQTALCQAAAPLMAEYTKRHIWPLDLNIYENAAMVVQETTHGQSAMSIDRAMVGYRLPMLRTSSGRAYLAFSSAGERALILSHLERLGDPADAPFLEPAWLASMIQDTRARGFALRDSGEFRSQTSSIAVPIIEGDEVLACLSLIWIRSALKTTVAVEKLAPSLCALASAILAATPGVSPPRP